MSTTTPGAVSPADPLDLAESVAGEEDPGASVELAVAANSPAGTGGLAVLPGDEPSPAPSPMAPGDEAPAGTPGTGEDVCPRCGGSGRFGNRPCPDCQGTGAVNVGIGGA